jgi:hypothetical protein
MVNGLGTVARARRGVPDQPPAVRKPSRLVTLLEQELLNGRFDDSENGHTIAKNGAASVSADDAPMHRPVAICPIKRSLTPSNAVDEGQGTRRVAIDAIDDL